MSTPKKRKKCHIAMFLLIDLKNPISRSFSFHSDRTFNVFGGGRWVEKESEYVLAHTRL